MIKWFAKGGGIARTGPFKSQAEAAAALRLSDLGKLKSWTCRVCGCGNAPSSSDCVQCRGPRPPESRTNSEFPDDAFVWPEVSTPKYKGKALKDQKPERRGK